MRLIRRLSALLLAALMLVLLVPAAALTPPGQIAILFTHDLHSHLMRRRMSRGMNTAVTPG